MSPGSRKTHLIPDTLANTGLLSVGGNFNRDNTASHTVLCGPSAGYVLRIFLEQCDKRGNG